MIRVGDLVRVLAIPPSPPLPGISSVDPTELIGRTYRVRRIHRDGIMLDTGSAEAQRGRLIPLLQPHQVEVVGHDGIRICEHLHPLVAAFLADQVELTANGDVYPSRGWGVAFGAGPGQYAQHVLDALGPKVDPWFENDPHFGGPEAGVICPHDRNAVIWPA